VQKHLGSDTAGWAVSRRSAGDRIRSLRSLERPDETSSSSTRPYRPSLISQDHASRAPRTVLIAKPVSTKAARRIDGVGARRSRRSRSAQELSRRARFWRGSDAWRRSHADSRNGLRFVGEDPVEGGRNYVAAWCSAGGSRGLRRRRSGTLESSAAAPRWLSSGAKFLGGDLTGLWARGSTRKDLEVSGGVAVAALLQSRDSGDVALLDEPGCLDQVVSCE